MATRIERVVLELDDNLTTGMARAAAATALLKRELAGVDGESVGAARSTRELGDEIDHAASATGRGNSALNSYAGRIKLVAQAVAVLGPALVPIGALGIPAIEGLAAGFGFAAIGAGTFALGMHGVGDALKAFNKAAMDPTAASINAAENAMAKLPPSTQQFVIQLHRLSPEIAKLRAAAGAEMFPGLADGLHAALRDGPLAQHALRGIGGELGNIARDAGRSLSSDTWRPFLKFAGQQAPIALDEMSSAAGSTLHALAAIWMAFQPMNAKMGPALVELADDFDKWAISLDRTKGFQDFLDYVNVNGPKVGSLLSEFANLLVDIVRAAAPLGGPVLDSLTLMLKVIDALVASPLGTPVLLLLQLNSVMSLTARALGGLGVEAKIGFGGVSLGAKEGTAQLGGLRAAALEAGQAVRQLATNAGRYTSSGTLLGQGVSTQGLANLAKGTALVGGLALVTSGATEKMNLTNTAMLAMAGSLAGPVGTALGAATGFTLDLAHANDDLEAAAHRVKAAMSGSGVVVDFHEQALAADELNKSLQQTQESMQFPTSGLHPIKDFQVYAAQISELLHHSASENAQLVADAREFSTLELVAFQKLALALGGTGDITKTFFSDAQLQNVADTSQAAMLALNISIDDLAAAAKRGDGSLGHLVGRIVGYINHATSAKGKSEAVTNAFAHMADKTLTLDDRISALTTALDALIDPMLNLGAARDAFTKGLNDMGKEINKHNKSLRGNTDAAIDNRNVIRERVSEIKAQTEAEANAGVSAKTMAENMRTNRQRLIESSVAAGLNRKEVEHMLNVMHLTPKDIKTTIDLLGAQQADRQLNNLHSKLEGLDGRVFHTTLQVRREGTVSMIATGGRVVDSGIADGGTVAGPRAPYGDRVVASLAPGEEVISNRHGQADQHRALLKAINARRYADGGTVAASRSVVVPTGGPGIDYGQMANAVAAVRPAPPLYGDVHVTDGYGGFKREMERDRAMASMSGVRRV